MKRTIIAALLIFVLCMPCAFAQSVMQMKVVNCEEWVSLREKADKASDRITKVNLGETVYGYESNGAEFTYCYYEGYGEGFIQSKYLEVVAAADDQGSEISGDYSYEYAVGDGMVRAYQYESGLAHECEILVVARYDAQEQMMWSYRTSTPYHTELELTNMFVNDMAPVPMVMVYNAAYGLVALDAETGETLWTLYGAEKDLGASIVHGIGADGTMYIGGYYGPDPVAISPDGEVLWSSSSVYWQNGDEQAKFDWIYNIEVFNEGIRAEYETGEVIYDSQGQTRVYCISDYYYQEILGQMTMN